MIEPTSIAEVPSATKLDAPCDTPSPGWLVRLLREPLVHFLLLGAGLFAADAYLGNDRRNSPSQQQIVVSAGKIEHLAAIFARTWQRPPTRQELEGLVDDYTREEAAYREGTAMGLDRNDTVIRRRIRQKLDFVAQDLANQLEPTEDELVAYLNSHADDFRVDPRFSFRQVFFNPQRHRGDLEEMVSDLVARLRNDPALEADKQGDPTLLEYRCENVSLREVGNLFGRQFAAALVDLPPGTWQGPVGSAYGVHAVCVDEVVPGSVPQLEEVRHAVRREWEHARQEKLTEEFYEGLLEKYDIVIEWPELAAEED